MNTLIYYSFNLMILAAVILIVGLIKPKWLFFWMETPSRLAAVALSMVVFMISAVMFGEGNRQLKQDTAKASASNIPAAPSPSADVPASSTPSPAVATESPQPDPTSAVSPAPAEAQPQP